MARRLAIAMEKYMFSGSLEGIIGPKLVRVELRGFDRCSELLLMEKFFAVAIFHLDGPLFSREFKPFLPINTF